MEVLVNYLVTKAMRRLSRRRRRKLVRLMQKQAERILYHVWPGSEQRETAWRNSR